MVWIGRIIACVVVLAMLPFHLVAPGVKLLALVDANLYEMLAGADPLVTSFLDAGWLPCILLLVSALALIGVLVGTLRGERFAARLVILAALFDALALYFSSTMGYVGRQLSWGEIAGLGLLMVVLWFVVRGVTTEE